jgi:hypothetical protein
MFSCLLGILFLLIICSYWLVFMFDILIFFFFFEGTSHCVAQAGSNSLSPCPSLFTEVILIIFQGRGTFAFSDQELYPLSYASMPFCLGWISLFSQADLGCHPPILNFCHH